MNSPRSARGGSWFFGITSILASVIPASGNDDSFPRGTLAVDRDMVRAGVRSELDWKITYPSGIDPIVEFCPPHIVKPRKDLKMKLRILGASFQEAKSNNGHGNNHDGVDVSNPGKGGGGPNGAVDLSGSHDDEKKTSSFRNLLLEVVYSVSGSAWQTVFYGYQNGVNPSKIVAETLVQAGSTITFGARGHRDGAWLPLYHTASASPNLVMLKDGDDVPATNSAFQHGQVESFLRPYLDEGGKVNIGERDLILLVELGQTDPRASGFDLQDLVILVTFE